MTDAAFFNCADDIDIDCLISDDISDRFVTNENIGKTKSLIVG